MDTRIANNLNGFVATQWEWSVEPTGSFVIVGSNTEQSVKVTTVFAESRVYRLHLVAQDASGCVIEKEKEFTYEE